MPNYIVVRDMESHYEGYVDKEFLKESEDLYENLITNWDQSKQKEAINWVLKQELVKGYWAEEVD